VYTIEAAHNPDVAGSNPPLLKRPWRQGLLLFRVNVKSARGAAPLVELERTDDSLSCTLTASLPSSDDSLSEPPRPDPSRALPLEARLRRNPA
jgi:hypothetical protein